VIDNKGYARLTDFGIARFFREDNSRDSSGTLCYMCKIYNFIKKF
jgi:hypothetical protein